MKLAPPVARAFSITSGLAKGKFEGETMSRSWRAAKETTSSWWRLTPGTSWVTLCHHCWPSRKDWAQKQ
ncbi:hypothetical protein D3C87_2016670 [compost metagenome]